MALLLRSAEAQPYLPRFVWYYPNFFFCGASVLDCGERGSTLWKFISSQRLCGISKASVFGNLIFQPASTRSSFRGRASERASLEISFSSSQHSSFRGAVPLTCFSRSTEQNVKRSTISHSLWGLRSGWQAQPQVEIIFQGQRAKLFSKVRGEAFALQGFRGFQVSRFWNYFPR